MVGSFGGPGPTAALTSPAQLAPPRRAQVAPNQRDTAVSVGSMLVAGNTKVTDLLCVTPPPIPTGRTRDDTACRASPRGCRTSATPTFGTGIRLRTAGPNPL